MSDYYADGARKPTQPGFFAEDRSRQLDTAWLDEPPPSARAAESPVLYVPAQRHMPPVEPDPRRRLVNWVGMPGRVSTARWSFGRTLANTVPVVTILAVASLLGVRWLFGVWSVWSIAPAVLLGVVWLVLALVDAARYSLRGGPPPPMM